MEKTKIALVTGGSSGIGFAIACELAAKGFLILLISNQAEQLETCKAEIESRFSVTCFILDIDLSATTAAQQVFDYCVEHQLEIEVLVNNAGMLIFSEVVQTPTKRLETILQLHMNTPTVLCRLFGAEMKERKSGSILNVSSISSVMPYPGISLYGPTKTYMRYFTRALRSEMKEHGVNVSCLLPGATETALYDPNRINLKLAKRLGVMQTAEYVARKAVKTIYRKKAECVPGIINKLTIWFMPIIPTFIIELINRRAKLLDKGQKSLG